MTEDAIYDPQADDYDVWKDVEGSMNAVLAEKRRLGHKHYRVESPIKREVVIGDCRLLLGDCREILPLLGRVDAVVTDPPYGIGESSKKAETRGVKPSSKWRNPIAKDYGADNWDKNINQDAIDISRGMSKHQIIFGGNYYSLPPAKCWLIWDKKNGDTDFADCELAWTNLDKSVRKIDWLWSGFKKQVPEDRFHLTQKPRAVMEWCIGHLPPETRTILDPFMGSGTTLVACAKLGKRGVGIEISEQHFETACARVRDAYSRPDMFAEVPRPPEPIQQPLFSEVTE